MFTFKSGGLHRGEVRLVGEDGSKYDDRRFFAKEVDQSIPVAIVKAQRHEIPYLDDAFYLENALSAGQSGGWAIRTTTLVAGDLRSEPLSNYKVIFCVNLPALNADVAERLRNYVAEGGNLVWIAGDNVTADAYNQMNEQAKRSIAAAPLVDVRTPSAEDNRDSWHINFLDKTISGPKPFGRAGLAVRIGVGLQARAHGNSRSGRGAEFWPDWTTASRCW